MLQRLKRLGAGLLLCALLSGLAAAPASAAGFQDVPAGHWAAESIQRCADLGFIQGESATRFGLGEPMTRAAFAVALQKELVRGYSSLARPIVLRSSSYNQQLRPGYLLVEVGGHGNTLTEAIAGARMWADNVARTLTSLGN